MSKSLKLVYFAWVRQEVGRASEKYDCPDDVITIGDLIIKLKSTGKSYAKAFAQPEKLRCAVNQEFEEFDYVLADGDEVAFFPPVTGG